MKNAPIPLTELPIEPTSETTFADMLPDYERPNEIQINPGAINRAAGWGGFYPDVQLRAFAGSTTRQIGGVIERWKGGSSTATVTYTQQTVNYDFISFDHELRRRAPLALSLNTQELTQRVQNRPGGGALRQPAIWAQEINNGIARSLRDATHHHLAAGSILPRQEAVVGAAVLILGQSAAMLLNTQEAWADQQGLPNLIFGALPTVCVSIAKAISVLDRKDLSFRDSSFSLCPVWQLDRLAVVAGLTHALRFAGTIPEKTQK